MKKYENLFFQGFFLFLFGVMNQWVIAQDSRFTASLSAATIAVNEQVKVTFELEGTGKNFQAPSFPDFNILMGPSQSSQMQIINGNMTQSISYSYVLVAVREGTFKIAPASIETGGKRVQSNELTIVVIKASASNQPKNNQNSDDTGASLQNKVFIKASVNQSSVYQGEGIVVTYRLFTSVNLVNYNINKAPSLEGFYSQEIELPQQLDFRKEVYDGVQYNVAEIKKMVVFPQRSGSLSIDAMKGEVVARVPIKAQPRSRNPFDAFFNDPFFGPPTRDVTIPLSSTPLTIQVRELPAGAPPSFHGAVGKYSVNTTFDKKEARAHDAINLKIQITGKGNIKLLDAPLINIPPDFEKYDPKILTNATASSNGVSGSKSFEYLMIPRTKGNYKVNVGDFSYFDPELKRYITIPGNDTELSIAKGDDNATGNISGYTKNDLQILGKDIRFNKINAPVFSTSYAPFYRSVLFYLLSLSPAVLFLLLLIFKKRYSALQQNTTWVRSRKANKVAMKRLSTAKKLLAVKNATAFLDEMFRALWGFVSDKLQIPVADLSKDNVSIKLAERQVKPETTQLLIEALDACEMARFAQSSTVSHEDIYQKGMTVISHLEEELS